MEQRFNRMHDSPDTTIASRPGKAAVAGVTAERDAALRRWESEGGSLTRGLGNLDPDPGEPEAEAEGIDPERSRAAALRGVLIGLSGLVLYVAWPLWPALVLASWTAGLSRRVLVPLERRLQGRRRAAAAISLVLFLAISLPLALLGVSVVIGAQEFAEAISQVASPTIALETIASGGDGVALPQLPTDLAEVFDLLQRYGEQGMSLLTNVAGAAATGVVALFIYFAGAFAILVDGKVAWAWAERHSPLRPPDLQRFAAAFHETGRGLLVGVGLTSLSQGLLATLIYLALGVPRWWVLGPITGVASLVPLVGSTLVWAPISIGFFLTDHPIKGIILAVVGLGVISTADNLLRPLFTRKGALKMPMFVLYVAIFGGVAAFGAWGVILGPLVVRLWMEALELRRERELGDDALGHSAAGTPSRFGRA